jgi:tetratricopeptide (TPR) repeat protein
VRRVCERVSVVLAVLAAASCSTAGAQEWRAAACDLKPGHFLVNSGVLYLKSATETKFADKREKDLHDAFRVLEQALTSGGQQKNPAAWYYLGRYYVETKDIVGLDSAFSRVVALAPACAADVNTYRRQVWVPVINAGIAAWQAGNTDAAIASFRRANQLYAGEPMGFSYLATLMSNAGQPDSAAKYFKLAAQAAQDPKFAKDKKDALFNLARVYHAAQRYAEAVAAYQEYLAAYPHDMQATAGLAAAYSLMGKGDQAKTMYTQILAHADSADAADLFGVGRAILNGIPNPPDTAAQGTQCRAEARRASRTLTTRQVAARCDSVTTKAMRDYDAAAKEDYRLVTQAFEAGLAKNPYDREALFTYAGAAALAGDTARAFSASQRLYAVDPLNRATLRMMAQSWRLKGRGDSTLHYLQVADSLSLEVTVSSFTPGEHDATLGGVFSNPRSHPTSPVTLTFEFLNAKGEVVAPQAQEVAPLAAGESRAFELKAQSSGIVAWRYRR